MLVIDEHGCAAAQRGEVIRIQTCRSIGDRMVSVGKFIHQVAKGSQDMFSLLVEKIPGYKKHRGTLRSRRYRSYITVMNDASVDVWINAEKQQQEQPHATQGKLVYIHYNFLFNVLNFRSATGADSGWQGLSFLERGQTVPHRIVCDCDSDVRIDVYAKTGDGSLRKCMYRVVPCGYSMHISDRYVLPGPEIKKAWSWMNDVAPFLHLRCHVCIIALLMVLVWQYTQ